MTKRTTIIKNVKLFWARLDEPTAPFGTPLYDVQLRGTKPQRKTMQSLGLKMRMEDGVEVTNVTRKATNAKGDSITIPVVDKELNPVDPKAIGNGTVANVKLFTYPYKTSDGREGEKTILMAIQVVDLVEFDATATGGIDFDIIS